MVHNDAGPPGETSPAARPHLDRAVHVMLHGTLDELDSILREHPSVVHLRSDRIDHHYCGYFHGATLLHHVAGNPRMAPLPGDVVARTHRILAAGADVDAATAPGPAQPTDIGWTPLGLVASSECARKAGAQRALMDVLLDAGADPDARDGGCVMGALYYGESDAAEHLAARRARLDLIAAAGVGDVDRVRSFLGDGPEAIASAPRLVHYARVPWPAGASVEDTVRHVLGLALVYAALHDRTEVLRLLLDAGAAPNHVSPFEHHATALHWAVMGDHPSAVRLLLAAGADPTAKDGEFGSTPAGWASYLDKPAAAAALKEAAR